MPLSGRRLGACAFLSNEATIAQRIVRAKKAIAKAGAVYEVPRGEELRARLQSVLSVIYLIFNEGYAATSGPDLLRPALSIEAQRLARILAGLMPDEPEVFGLLALIEIQSSRFAARVGADGLPVLLTDQNRAKWDRLSIRRGLAALERAHGLGGAPAPYVLQADLAACHARALTADATDWPRIAGLYDTLLEIMPSPVVALNRAVAHCMAFGPDIGLQLIADIEASGTLANYALLPAAKGDFLLRANRKADAKAKFEEAAALSGNEKERGLLLRRAAECGD